MPKTTEKLFPQKYLTLFKSKAEYWFRYFGLLDFDLKVRISSTNMDNLAEATCDHLAKYATITISKYWPSHQLNEYEVKVTAFHEVCEVLLGRLRALANGKFSEEEVNETIHAVINRLQNSVYK